LIVESKEDVEPKESLGLGEDVGKDSITDKDIKEVLSISTSLLEIPTTGLPSKEDANGVLNIIGNVAEGNLEFMESFSHLSLMRASSLMMFAVDPQLQSFHHGHQAFFTAVKLKVYTNGKICKVLSDPSGHSVIPIPYQNHGESVTECSLLESVLESPHFSFEPTDFSLLKSILESPHFNFEPTDFSLLKSILESPHFSFEPTDLASPHLLETDDLSQSVLATISPVFGMQTANDSLVSRDDETASGDKNLDICTTLVNFIATLEQQFITIDNLLDEEDIDPFMDDEIELVMTVLIDETSKSHMSSVYGLIVARLPTSLDDSQEMRSDDDTISSLFPEVVEFVMDLGVELEDRITDMLAIN
jgi:hypothetical protein